jgi:hypothetical protein
MYLSLFVWLLYIILFDEVIYFLVNIVGWVDNVLICLYELCIWVRGYDVSFG